MKWEEIININAEPSVVVCARKKYFDWLPMLMAMLMSTKMYRLKELVEGWGPIGMIAGVVRNTVGNLKLATDVKPPAVSVYDDNYYY